LYRKLFVPDIQFPLHNKRQVNSLAGFIKAIQPDDVIQVGDFADFTSLGRWVKNRRGEYDPNIRQNIDGVKKLIDKLGITKWKRGNHDERLDKYVEENAPALRGFPGLSIEEAFGLEDSGVEYLRDLYEFTPGWVVAHGDEASGTAAYAGGTAVKLSSKVGKSVVCGHTHKAAIIPTTESFNGIPTRTLFGVEVGHMMDMGKATYLKGQYANWQSAFAVVDISNKSVQPYLIYVSQTGSFQFEGRSWEDGRQRKGSSK
jgi:UDP-2,3-diacylglucosamine pyrophosphatase LpxH